MTKEELDEIRYSARLGVFADTLTIESLLKEVDECRADAELLRSVLHDDMCPECPDDVREALQRTFQKGIACNIEEDE